MACAIAVTSLSLVPLASQTSEATSTAAGPLATTPRQARELAAAPRVVPEKCSSAHRGLRYYHSRYTYWRSRSQHGSAVLVTHSGSCARVRHLAELWRGRARTARRSFLKWHHRYVVLYEKWRCIHEHEGAWDSNTGNGYWGGLQMDWGFMHTYGPEFIRRWGLADKWPVWAQLEAAERAFWGYAGYAGRGYSPWGTRGMCGL